MADGTAPKVKALERTFPPGFSPVVLSKSIKADPQELRATQYLWPV